MERLAARVAAHPHLVLAGAAVAGLALAEASHAHVVIAALAVGGVLMAAGGSRLGQAAAALLALGALIGAARVEALDAAARAVPADERVAEPATLIERPRPGRFGSSAAVELESGTRLLVRAPAGMEWPRGGSPGTVVHLEGRTREPRRGRGFDWPAHLRRRGIALELEVWRMRGAGRRGELAGAVDRMRERAEVATARGLSPEHAALVRGMVLGQDERISERVRSDFRDAGLGHLLAVSGQNVMLLAALALPLLGAAGAGPRVRVAALLALIAVYVPLAGAGPPLQRAGVMGAAGLVALAAGRPSSRWYCLLLAAGVTLAANPLVLGEPGWQLSFAAVVGILAIVPPLRPALARLPRALAEGILVTFAATLATAPLVAFHFGSLPLVGLASNLAALPAVAPVMWIGMLQSALGQLPSAGAVDAACSLLGALARWPVAWLELVAARCAELPGAQARLPLHSPLALCAAYALVSAGVVALRRAAPYARLRSAPWLGAWRRWPRQLRLGLAAGLVALAVLGTQAALAPGEPPALLTVSFLDVGQGDATLVQHPDGSAVLFDGGPAEARVARVLHRAGVRRLSAVVATHASADHHGGLLEVLERFPVGVLVDGGDGSPDAGFRALLREAEERGVPRVAALAGRDLRAGGLTIRILAPPPRRAGPAPEDPNPRATVAVVSSGQFDLLLSADAESPSLLPLALPDVDAMKVPHHGSEDPGLGRVLERARPEVAVIEVGQNSYGHPAPPTLEVLARAVPHVYRTDRHGTVSLSVDHGRLAVRTAR